MSHAKTLEIPSASRCRVISAPARIEPTSPLRLPDLSLTPRGQAVELLDCIDEAVGWVDAELQISLRLARGLPQRAAALGLSTADLRSIVAIRLGDVTYESMTRVPRASVRLDRLFRDIEEISVHLRVIGTRARVAIKHVMHLALMAPGLVRRPTLVSSAPADGHLVTADAWFASVPARAKMRADRSRIHLGSLPVQAELLRQRLRRITVPRLPFARPQPRSLVPTARLVAAGPVRSLAHPSSG